MKLPRDLSGEALAILLGKYGYKVTRQTGSHMRLTTNDKGAEHHLTVPRHKPLRVGTLSSIIGGLAVYLELDKDSLANELFR